MRRPLALHAVVALAVIAATPARATEPLDIDLARLGAPSRGAWQALDGSLSDAQADALAGDARVRFGRLASDLALAFSSTLLQPASTTGHSAFHFDMEGAYAGVGGGLVGSAPYPVGTAAAYPRGYWPTDSLVPHELFIPSIHVRKALPFSLELGGRLQYLSQSSYFGAQAEAKWALVEGFWVLPDVALRGAYTMVLGQRDLNLSVTEFDAMISKRFGVNAVTSLTPYAAARFSLVRASTPSMNFRPEFDQSGNPTPGTPAQVAAASAAFPTLDGFFYRTTGGVRLTSFAVSLAIEATWFTGGTVGKKSAGAGDYPEFKVPGSWSSAAKFGFEF